jgi:dCMP deaminase
MTPFLLKEVTSLVDGDSWLPTKQSRPDREELYLAIAQLLRTQSTCTRGQVGAVLVRDRRIIATGYNGSPPGMPHCLDVGCQLLGGSEQGCQRAVHAEANVLAFAARHAGGAGGATLYSTAGPCLKCAQLIVSSGITSVVFQTPYRLPDGVELLDAASIPVREYPKPWGLF